MAAQAVWRNVPADLRAKFKGGVEALTSGQFIALAVGCGEAECPLWVVSAPDNDHESGLSPRTLQGLMSPKGSRRDPIQQLFRRPTAAAGSRASRTIQS
jgi:hypothetical protein